MHSGSVSCFALGFLLTFTGVARTDDVTDADETFFETSVRPVLAGSCIECHGPKKASGGLRLDSHSGMSKGGDSGPVLEPASATSSLLLRAIRRDPDAPIKMPPEKPLSKQAVEDLTRWIEAGAKWPKSVSAPIPSDKRHWAFEPLAAVAIPDDPTGWASHPIDRFIEAARREIGLSPVNLASRQAFLRRASFDLIGLPPTPEQVDAFLRDESPNAYATAVDELLGSQRYGERWGRHWLDLVRYADTAGDNADYPIPQAYLYRDYVIDAFNSDVPYDRFLHEQLAGDIIAKASIPPASDETCGETGKKITDSDVAVTVVKGSTAANVSGARMPTDSEYARRVIATGFIAQSKRIGTRELEDMHLIIEDTLSTLGPAIMGLSIRCARCHDHKFDPLTMEDYYALYGFFASTQYPFAGAEEVRKQTKFAPLIPPGDVNRKMASREAELDAFKSQIASLEKDSEVAKRIGQLEQSRIELEKQIAISEPGLQKEPNENRDSSITPNAPITPILPIDPATNRKDLNQKLANVKTDLTMLRQELDEKVKPLRDKLSSIEKSDPLQGVPTAYAVGDLQPVDASIQTNGNPRSSSGKTARRGIPKILDNRPLEIPSGASGRLELAHWLTSHASFLTSRVMVSRIWQHHFGKPIVPTPSDFGFRGTPPTHPELLDWLANEFIASGWSIKALHRMIMSSKTYQLSTDGDARNSQIDSGNTWYWRFDRRRLDAESLRDSILTLSGSLDLNRPGPHPFPEPSKWRYTAHHQFNHVCYPSDHRSVYLMVQRLHSHPYLSLFNGADPSLSTPSRDNSSVPLQSLYLLNNEFVHQQASKFANSILAHSSNLRTRIDYGFLRAYGRRPTELEVVRCSAYIDQYTRSLEADSVPADRREIEVWSSWARTLFASNEFFFVE